MYTIDNRTSSTTLITGLEGKGAQNFSCKALNPSTLDSLPTSTIDSAAHSLDSPAGDETSNKLFIGGITLQVDLSLLQQHLTKIAHCQGILSISIARRTKNSNFSGYGFITSTVSSDLSKLLQLKTFKFDESWIGIKPYLLKKSDIRQLKSDKDNRKIHIKGINHKVSEADLDNYFSGFGLINHIKINKSQFTGYYKGFAFIEFAQSSTIAKILKNPIHFINGVSLYCERSRSMQQESWHLSETNIYSPIAMQSAALGSSLALSKLTLIEKNHFSQNIRINSSSKRSFPLGW